jgi:hypothetical protein
LSLVLASNVACFRANYLIIALSALILCHSSFATMADDFQLLYHAGQRGFAEKIRIMLAETGLVRTTPFVCG